MKLQDMQDEWEQDCSLDQNHLDNESARSPSLHAKWVRRLNEARLRKIKAYYDMKELRGHKFRYYRGEMTKAELADHGWSQYQGTKPLKSEMEELLETDKDMIDMKIKLEYLETTYSFLEEVMKAIRSRDWTIRNAIEWKKFIAGM